MKHLTPPALRHLESKLEDLELAGLLRRRAEPAGPVAETFCSNDYLGLADLGSPPAGAGASRLIVGERSEHVLLECALSKWLRSPSTLLFTSGYAANVGVLSSLVGPGDLVISDALNHASIIDGCRLSRGEVVVVPHLDVDRTAALLAGPRTGRAWVVTESYFSMDADSPNLVRLRELCDRAEAGLIVDEAHALGVFGPQGRGLAAEVGVTPDALIGTLGKSFGAAGAFAAGATALTEFLWNRARSFVFSTGLSPLVASAALSALPEVSDSARRHRLHKNAKRLRSGLIEIGVQPLGHGPIVPIVVGSAQRALLAADALRRDGVHALAIRPPTVPDGTARIRLTVTAAHSSARIDEALRAFRRSFEWLAP